MTRRALILARGLGSRMRRADPAVALDPAQATVADQGLKAMIPVGRPFLDYVLSGLADAGCTEICLVIGPEHGSVRRYYETAERPTRFSLSFAIQERPLGTADAVLAGEAFAGGESVLVLNADNLYPQSALKDLAALHPCVRAPGHSPGSAGHAAGLLGFRQSALVAGGNIPAERVRAFALISVTGDGCLEQILEKPSAVETAGFGSDPLVSMNAWLLPPAIYAGCRAVKPSVRGELELQDAVRYSMERLGDRFRVIESQEPVLDLSSRGDIPAVAARLSGVEVRL